MEPKEGAHMLYYALGQGGAHIMLDSVSIKLGLSLNIRRMQCHIRPLPVRPVISSSFRERYEEPSEEKVFFLFIAVLGRFDSNGHFTPRRIS